MLCAYDAYKIHGIQYWYNYILYNVTPAWFYVVAWPVTATIGTCIKMYGTVIRLQVCCFMQIVYMFIYLVTWHNNNTLQQSNHSFQLQ